LVIDEIGYLPIQKQEENLLSQLLAMCYGQHPTIITTNIVLSRWDELFQSPEIAAANLDRLVHHVKIFKITGNDRHILLPKNYNFKLPLTLQL
jgi:DNA replication protein DnaC